MAKRFVIPFATSGDKSVTPDATDPGGAISYSQGWPVAYQLADTDPNYRPVGRQEMNGVLFDVTGALAEIQALGYPEWVAVAGLVTPYAINATMRHNGAVWRNTVANNSVEPGTDTTWVVTAIAETLTTGGVSPAFTLTPVPALPGYATGQYLRVRFSATPVGTPTINVSALGVKNLKQYDASGVKVPAVIAANQITGLEYDGTDWVVMDPLPPAQQAGNLVGISGVSKNRKASATGTNATVTITADEIMVENVLGEFKTLRNVSVTPSLAVSGLNGLDVGSSVASTWYCAYVIWNPTTNTIGGLLSLSTTGPTLLPAGYTHWALVTVARSDSNPANKFPISFIDIDGKWRYKVAAGSNLTATTPQVATGVTGDPSAPTYVSASLANFVPSIAASVLMRGYTLAASANLVISPSAAITAVHGAPMRIANGATAGTAGIVSAADIVLESINIFWATNDANGRIFVDGFTLNF